VISGGGGYYFVGDGGGEGGAVSSINQWVHVRRVTAVNTGEAAWRGQTHYTVGI
jgi:hypothetical protein